MSSTFGRFAGRRVVVTGGASGIGLACAELLAERGAQVVIIDRQADAAHAVALRIGGAAYVLDIAQVEQVEQVAARMEAELGPVDALASVAGIVQGQAVPPEQIPWTQYNQIFEVNLRGTHAVCAAFGSRMARRGRGAIVNIASISAVRSTPLHAYGPMKAAIVGLTENLAGEWGRSGVRVNAVSPGFVAVPRMVANIQEGKRYAISPAEVSALGRLVEPAEVAESIAFLLSDRASAITGANIAVDAGVLATNGWLVHGGVPPARPRQLADA